MRQSSEEMSTLPSAFETSFATTGSTLAFFGVPTLMRSTKKSVSSSGFKKSERMMTHSD